MKQSYTALIMLAVITVQSVYSIPVDKAKWVSASTDLIPSEADSSILHQPWTSVWKQGKL